MADKLTKEAGKDFLVQLIVDDDIKVTKLGHRVNIFRDSFKYLGCYAGYGMGQEGWGKNKTMKVALMYANAYTPANPLANENLPPLGGGSSTSTNTSTNTPSDTPTNVEPSTEAPCFPKPANGGNYVDINYINAKLSAGENSFPATYNCGTDKEQPIMLTCHNKLVNGRT